MGRGPHAPNLSRQPDQQAGAEYRRPGIGDDRHSVALGGQKVIDEQGRVRHHLVGTDEAEMQDLRCGGEDREQGVAKTSKLVGAITVRHDQYRVVRLLSTFESADAWFAG